MDVLFNIANNYGIWGVVGLIFCMILFLLIKWLGKKLSEDMSTGMERVGEKLTNQISTGIQDASCVGPGKSNLPLELRRKAGHCSRVTAGPIDLI